MEDTTRDFKNYQGYPYTLRGRGNEERRYYSLDVTEGSSINNTDSSPMKHTTTQRNHNTSKTNVNTNNASTLQERWNNYQSRTYGKDSLRLEVDVSDYRSSRHEGNKNVISPDYSRFSNASTIKQKNSSEINVSGEEIHVLDHRDETFGRHENHGEMEDEEDHHDNSFHLGLESMETDISSITDTMSSTNGKYQNISLHNLTKSKSLNHYDNYEEEQQEEVFNTDRLVAGERRHGEINATNDTLRHHSRHKASSPQNDSQRSNCSTTNIYDSKLENPYNNTDSRIDRSNSSYYSRTEKSIRRNWHHGPISHVASPSNTYSSFSSSKRLANAKSPSMAKPNSINIRSKATLSTEETSQSVCQDWAMIAVSVAASLLESGECKEIAEAATAAILSVGGSSKLQRSTALEAAAEASTAVLSAGCNQLTAATVAVTVLKACEMIPKSDESSCSLNSLSSCTMEHAASKSFGGNNCATPRATGSSRAKGLPSLSENQSRDDITEVEFYETNERAASHSYTRTSSIMQDGNRQLMLANNTSHFSFADGNTAQDTNLQGALKHQLSSMGRISGDHAGNHERRHAASRSRSEAKSLAASQLQPREEHGPMPFITNAINQLYLNTKESINNVLDSEQYNFLIECKSPSSLPNHGNEHHFADSRAVKQPNSNKPSLLSDKASSKDSSRNKESECFMYDTTVLDANKMNPSTSTAVSAQDRSTKSSVRSSKTLEGSSSSRGRRKKSSKKPSKTKVAKND